MTQQYIDRLSFTPLGEQGDTTGCRLWFTVPNEPDSDVPWNVIAAPTDSHMQFSWPTERQRQPDELSTAVKEHMALVGAGATVYCWLRLKSGDLATPETPSSGIEFKDISELVDSIKAMAKTRPYRDVRLRAEALALEDSTSTLSEIDPVDVQEPFNMVWVDEEDGDKSIKVSISNAIYTDEQWTELERALAVASAGGRHRWTTATTKSDNPFHHSPALDQD